MDDEQKIEKDVSEADTDPKPEPAAKNPEAKEPEGLFDTGLLAAEGMRLYGRGRQPRRSPWSIAWADLMMTMFILFAVLYIYQAANREFSFGKKVTAGVGETESVKKPISPRVETVITPLAETVPAIPLSENEIIRLENLQDIKKVDLVENKAVRIMLPGDLLFDTGRAELRHVAIDTLWEVGDAIRLTDFNVNVVGHTDDVPIHTEQFATNWELSAMRACVVARFLMEQMKISPERFVVSGQAYLQPLKPNTTSGNRRTNRRVEVILTKKKAQQVNT